MDVVRMKPHDIWMISATMANKYSLGKRQSVLPPSIPAAAGQAREEFKSPFTKGGLEGPPRGPE